MGRSRKRGADGGEGTRPPTIVDVAARAQVSYQTVSRVLNEHPSVRPTTRQAVLDAMAGLGYRPSNAARTLVTGRSRTLGVLALDVADSDGLTPLYGIERSARELGYFVGIGNLTSVDRASVRAAVDHLAEQSVAGLLVIAPIDAADDALVTAPSDLPIVAVEGSRSGVVASAGVDQVAGARLATEHLLALGHDTVFHIRGPSEWMQTQDRVNGWRSALEAAGADVPMPLAGDWTAKSGYEAGQVLSRVSGLTAVFAGNDQTALGLLLAFSERGIRVPEDVSVVGFDDGADAPFYNPPLTTVRQDFRAVGRTAISMLVNRIEDGARDLDHDLVEPELVVRQSTASARA
ncbi:MAG TPA: LacI family DNA-binding transcriptional regulator [Nocardioides sp.]|uniref:LacI family DNA-binding transcriptional regulator n=1 Tax=Nocardioides sp. TaxID=35761 RepID=UPI002E2EC9F5|nr:LacI family DNA-binding transcriptional regulator [Nocardioides sp.]HEX3930910.1 LacI family DNA-binding transcriptional regulator [Nocardioides sp.]